MKNSSLELRFIQQCLDEVAGLSKNESLREILGSLTSHHGLTINFANYALGSHTLGDARQLTLNLERITSAADYLRRNSVQIEKSVDLFFLNQLVLGSHAPQPRHEELMGLFHFPHPKAIDEGLQILILMLHESRHSLFVRRVAFIQGLISLHPFADGNHRTARLLLDHWLCEMSLPTTTLTGASEFIFTNSVDQQLFSLEDAIQKVLYCIGNTLKL